MKDFEALVARLADEAVTVTPAPHPYRSCLTSSAAATVYLALALAVSGLRPDLRQAFAQTWFSAEIAALLLLFISTSFCAALLSFPDLYQMRRLSFAPWWALALFLLVMVVAWRADSPPAALPVHSVECTASIALFAVFPAAWAFSAMRRFASTHYRLAGSVAVLAAFSVGALWLRLHELNDSIVHVIEWHYLPMLAAAMIGSWLGRRLLTW